MGMQQLIYASRPLGFGSSALAEILSVSLVKNAALDITGALICRSDIYLQLLEGPVAAVEGLYESICRDRRHAQVTLLVKGKTPDRLFPDWAMRCDPERSILWSPEDVAAGAFRRANAREVREIFVRFANLPPG